MAASPTSHIFNAASEHYLSHSGKSFSYENKSRLYGLYKQATLGDVKGPQPTSLFNSWKGDRWTAWAACKGMSQSEAQREYVELISNCDPTFKPVSSKSRSKTAKSTTSEAAAAAAATRTAVANASLLLPLPEFEVNDQVFEAAYNKVNQLKWSLDAADKLGLYGLFKQAKFGDNNTARPGMLDPVGGAKWDAWFSRQGKSTQSMQEQYVAMLLRYEPKWLPPQHCLKFKQQQEASSSYDNQFGGTKNDAPTKKGNSKKKKGGSGNNTSNTDENSSFSDAKRSSSSGSLLQVNTKSTDFGGDSKDNTSTGGLVRTNSILGLSTMDDDNEHVSKKGWLFKMRQQGINVLSWSSSDRWGERYFVLSGGNLRYYRSEEEATPRGTFALHRCTVKKEGAKITRSGKTFYIMALYLHGTEDTARGPSSGALLRVSSESEALIEEWFMCLAPRTRNNLLLSGIIQGQNDKAKLGQPLSPKEAEIAAAGMLKGSNLDQTMASTDLSKPKKKKTMDVPASKPMHRKAQASFLSNSESSKQDYRGLFNLGGLILLVSNIRMFLKNFLIYGLLLKFALPSTFSQTWTSTNPSDHPILMCYILNQVCLVTAFCIEFAYVKRGGARGKHGFFTIFRNWNADAVVNFSHFVNILTCITIPTIVVWQYTSPPNSPNEKPGEYFSKTIEGFFLLMVTVVMFMKLISYAHVHHDYRKAAREAAAVPMDQIAGVIARYTNTVDDTEQLVRYPYNVTLGDIYYFWLAPTLTYQINFPRSKERRLWMIFSLLVRMFTTASLMIFLAQQHIMPSIKEATLSMDRLQPLHILERLLTMCVPVTYMWLLMFYLIFHLFLNFLAEILRFGDRVFYKDWWNSNTFEEYWRLWNLPVHYWLVRHLYFPCQRAGLPRTLCVFLVFFFSAALHELIVSVPFHLPRIYAFAGMLGQIPLVALTKAIEKNPLWKSINGGNFLFWATFCVVGQPMAVLLYYYDIHILYQQGTGSVFGVVKGLVTSALYAAQSQSEEL